MDLSVYSLEKSSRSTIDALLLVCLSLCAVVFLTIAALKLLGPIAQ